jgi:Glycosyl hydrolases family 38 N-terminal domain/Alpha mannosidase middle domain
VTRLTVVPHTHWDREWYLPFKEFRRRLVPVLDEVLDLADAGYPHFHLDGQTALVDDYLELRPEREPEVRRHVASGRISLGPWLTLVDEFLVSGETIVRDLELGLARSRELGASGTPIGYLPDQFGHVGQMPQLLRAGGIQTAVVWRGVPASVDRSVFRWESPDGSAVLAEYLPFGYSLGIWLRGADDPETLVRSLRRTGSWLEPFAARKRLLVPAGSDHAPPDATLPERLVVACRLAPDLDVRIGSLAEHLAQPTRGELPVWRGELRSAARAHLLPNVVSARINQKQERAEAEALLERYAEPLAALVPGFEWPQRQLEQAWRLLVLNGAHDSVCGCSIDEVARAVDGRCAEAHALAAEIADGALAALAEQVRDEGIVCFNPSPFERDGVPGLGWGAVPEAPHAPEPLELTVEDGRIVLGGVVLELTDEPDAGDLYNFESGDAAVAPRRVFVQANGVVAAFDGFEVRLQASRRPEEPFFRLDVTIRNDRPDHRLRLRLRLPQAATGSLGGSPFELVERGFASEGSDVEASSPTWPARGAVLAGGLAVLGKGVIEYEAAERALAVTLLRCVGTISRPSLPSRPGRAGPDVATPGAQMLGETRLAIAVLPRAQPADLLPGWEQFALPLRCVRARGGSHLPDRGTLLEVHGAELSSVRRRAGALEVRLWNPAKTSVSARVGGRDLELGAARIETIRFG